MKKILKIIAVVLAILIFIIFLIFFNDDYDCGADYDCALEKFGSLSFESNKAHSEII